MLDAMRRLLESWGCQDHDSHLEDAAQHFGPAAPPLDLLIVDYCLRRHASGIETIARLRELAGTPVPALVITGDTALRPLARGPGKRLSAASQARDAGAASRHHAGTDWERDMSTVTNWFKTIQCAEHSVEELRERRRVARDPAQLDALRLPSVLWARCTP